MLKQDTQQFDGRKLALLGVALLLVFIAWIPLYNWVPTAWVSADLDTGSGATIPQAIVSTIFWLVVIALLFGLSRAAGGLLDAWNTTELVTMAVLAVIFAVIFNLWSAVVSGPLAAAYSAAGAWNALFNGVWFIPGFLIPYIIRKPGAALLGEGVAGFLSFLLGSPWGFMGAAIAGLTQGIGAEVPFAATNWRNYRLPVMLASGFISTVASFVFVYPMWNAAYAPEWNAISFIANLISVEVIGVGGSILLAEALKNTGVLNRFAIVRDAKSKVA
jgi:energy-coupling factor transport system permease protein